MLILKEKRNYNEMKGRIHISESICSLPFPAILGTSLVPDLKEAFPFPRYLGIWKQMTLDNKLM